MNHTRPFIDAFRLQMEEAARATASALRHRNVPELPCTRGESSSVVAIPGTPFVFGHNEEFADEMCLVAQAMYDLNGRTRSYFDLIARDLAARTANSLSQNGVRPQIIALSIVAGSDDWFSDQLRITEFITGWRTALVETGISWGGDDSEVIRDGMSPDTALVSASAVGVMERTNILNPEAIEHNDVIVALGSASLQGSGLAQARALVPQLPDGYSTTLGNGQTYGEALLEPTPFYTDVVDDALQALGSTRNCLHYAANIAGSWKRIMRAPQPFEYHIHTLPEMPPVFQHIQEAAQLKDQVMFDTFGNGIGFVLIVPERHVDTVLVIAEKKRVSASVIGRVKKNGKRRLVIKPKGLRYDG